MNYHILALSIITSVLLPSCASYMTPGAAADMSKFTDPKVKESFSARPAVTFPANLAVARVQGSGYKSESTSSYGSGAFSVVTNRDIETDADMARLSKLAGVSQVVMLNRLLLPSELKSDLDLRNGAAKLQADLVLVYTVNTEFSSNSVVPPLTTISLGLLPNSKYKVNSNVAALIMDTKTGFIYGTVEETASDKGIAIPLFDTATFEKARKDAERAAFDKALTGLESLWSRIHARYR